MATEPGGRPGVSENRFVSTCRVAAPGHASAHELASQAAIGRRLAGLLGRAFVEAADASPSAGPGAGPGAGRSPPYAPGEAYWVPNDTIVGVEAAGRLGIRDRFDLFGGVVPHAFVATKAITHPLVADAAAAPEGWCPEFGRQVDDGTLPGFTAFTATDARLAGRRLLAFGPVRVKPVAGTGGRGQHVIAAADALDALVDTLADAFRPPGPGSPNGSPGLVLEQDLEEIATFSVGQVELPGLVASYIGTQETTRDNAGDTGYGGSTLDVVRGGFERLAACGLSADARAALERARAYDAAALRCFPGLFASRRNYDVVVGLDARGQRCCGVLEQSWRVGGASPAEVAALTALHADPALRAVRAGCVERFGAAAVPPSGADVHYHGVDPQAGALLKYAWSEGHADDR